MHLRLRVLLVAKHIVNSKGILTLSMVSNPDHFLTLPLYQLGIKTGGKQSPKHFRTQEMLEARSLMDKVLTNSLWRADLICKAGALTVSRSSIFLVSVLSLILQHCPEQEAYSGAITGIIQVSICSFSHLLNYRGKDWVWHRSPQLWDIVLNTCPFLKIFYEFLYTLFLF